MNSGNPFCPSLLSHGDYCKNSKSNNFSYDETIESFLYCVHDNFHDDAIALHASNIPKYL